MRIATAGITGVFQASLIDDSTLLSLGSVIIDNTQPLGTVFELSYTALRPTARLRLSSITCGPGGITLIEVVFPVVTYTSTNVLANICGGGEYRYGYNGQMKVNEIAGKGNHYQYKFRDYDPTTTRFISVDPLYKKYPWNGSYNFAEDRPIDGLDLEGKEWSSSTQNNVTMFTVKVNIGNASKLITDVSEISKLANGIKADFESSFSKTVDGHTYKAIMDYNIVNNPNELNPFSIILRDIKTDKDNYWETGRSTFNSSQVNTIKVAVSIDGERRNMQEIGRTASHELGHSAGLTHPWQKNNDVEDIKQTNPENKNAVINNLMNSDENNVASMQSAKGKNLTKGQLEKVQKNVETQQLHK